MMLVYIQEIIKTLSFRRKLVLVTSFLVQVPLITATIALNAHSANMKIQGLPAENHVEIALYVLSSVSGVIGLLTLVHELWARYQHTLTRGHTEIPDGNINCHPEQDSCIPLSSVSTSEDSNTWTEWREVTSVQSIDLTELTLNMNSLYLET